MGFGDDENTKMYLKSSGQRILEAEEGLAVFDRILAQTSGPIFDIGRSTQPGPSLFGFGRKRPAAAVAVNSGSIRKTTSANEERLEMKGLSLEQCLEWDLKEQISQLLKISRDKIERDENLADFGFDSISLTQLAIHINQLLWN